MNAEIVVVFCDSDCNSCCVQLLDWTESWIRGILAFHVFVLVIVLLFRKNPNVQCVIFLLLCAIIRGAEYLNSYCANHWTEFSRQNYFDKQGVFAGTVFAGPLLAIAFIQLVRIKQTLICNNVNSIHNLNMNMYMSMLCCFTLISHRLLPLIRQVNFLYLTACELIVAKRLELKRKMERSKRKEEEDAAKSDGGGSATASVGVEGDNSSSLNKKTQ